MQPAIRYYKLDNRALSYADCWSLTRGPAFLFLAFLKLFRIPLQISDIYLPEHRPLPQQLSREDEISAEALAELDPRRRELEALGYKWLIFHSLKDELFPSGSHALAMVSPDGRIIAKVICVIQNQGLQKIKNVVTALVSPLESGRFACTAPRISKGFAPSARVIANPSKVTDIPRLLAEHERFLTTLTRDAVKPVSTYQDFINVTDEYEGMHLREKVQLGVYKEISAQELEQVRKARVLREASTAASITNTTPLGAPPLLNDATAVTNAPATPQFLSEQASHVQLEINRQLNPRQSWKANAWLLVITAILFAFSFKNGMDWTRLGILMFVLVIHELGHYVAMKLFGYRNVRMFFLPFFGAAVSGRKFGVEAWRKAAVSLAGPVPGIILGGLLMFRPPDSPPWVSELYVMFLILNLFNLAPILPLDGGWFWHSILFSRHPVADVIFRVVTALILIAVALLAFDSIMLAVVGGFMLFAVPQVLRSGRIAADLRREGAIPNTANLQEVPPAFTELTLARMQAAMPSAKLHTKQAAPVVLDIFERVTSKPAGILASILLAVVYAGAVLFGTIAILIPMLLRMSH